MMDPRDFIRSGDAAAVGKILAGAACAEAADPLVALWRKRQVAHAVYHAAMDRPFEGSVEEHNALIMDLYRSYSAVEEEIAATPASTLAGLAIKIRCAVASLREHTDDDPPEDYPETGNAILLLLAIGNDVERLLPQA